MLRERFRHLAEDVKPAVLGLAECDAHDFFGDAGDLDVHLQRGNAALGASHLEVHVAEMVLVTENVREHGVALLLQDETHCDAGGRPLEWHSRIHQCKRSAAHRCHGGRPVRFGDLRDDAQRVGELVMRRQNRMNGAPGELAVTDLAPAGAAHPPGLADGKWRKVVMQKKCFLVGAVERVDPLLVLAGAQRGHDQRLRLAAGEQSRAVSTRQHADLGHDRTYRLHVAAIDAAAAIEDVPAHDLGFALLEDVADLLLRIGRLRAFRAEMRHRPCLGGVDRIVPFFLVPDAIGGPQIGLDQCQHFLFERRVVRLLHFARLSRCLFGEPDDGFDYRLKMPMAEHHGPEHHVLAQLLGLRLHHQHGVLRAGHDQVELRFRHLVEHRIEHVFVADEPDAGRAERAHEWRARKGQCRRGCDHRQNVGVVLQIVRQCRHDHLGLVAPAIGEQRPDRPVDQPRDQRLLLGGTAFALEIAARNATSSVEFFLVVDGQWQKVDAFPRLLVGDHGRQHLRFAVSRDDGAVGLASDLSGL